MYGAILGDIIGSPFEFDRGDKTKTFKLFTEGCEFTDDTVMTIAVAEALLSVGKDAKTEKIEEAVINRMQYWGAQYPYAGYGYRFGCWLEERNPQPYNSFGNGSAMRVSAAGWLYDTLDQTRDVARATAVVTHNHPEGIKGAEATASAIFLARNGASKEEINDFEDTIRNAVSLSGDADTIGAIAGSIGEAFYGVPAGLIEECKARMDSGHMIEVLDKFNSAIGR